MSTTHETRTTAKDRKRAEAEERNARPQQTLACGHTTALSPEIHVMRCGAVR